MLPQLTELFRLGLPEGCCHRLRGRPCPNIGGNILAPWRMRNLADASFKINHIHVSEIRLRNRLIRDTKQVKGFAAKAAAWFLRNRLVQITARAQVADIAVIV